MVTQLQQAGRYATKLLNLGVKKAPIGANICNYVKLSSMKDYFIKFHRIIALLVNVVGVRYVITVKDSFIRGKNHLVG